MLLIPNEFKLLGVLKRGFTFITTLISLLVLLSSCQSIDKKQFAESEQERARKAIEQLSIDMLSSLSIDIPIENLEKALPASYRQYEAYVPLYESYEAEYLKGVATICQELLPLLFDKIYDEMTVLAKTPELFLKEDTSFSLALYENLRNDLLHDMLVLLRSNEEKLSEAFEISENEFISVANAYQNLSSVGEERELVVPEEISLFVVATVSVDSLFESLKKAEKSLKNQVIDRNSESVYSIFWEGR